MPKDKETEKFLITNDKKIGKSLAKSRRVDVSIGYEAVLKLPKRVDIKEFKGVCNN